MCPKCFRPPAQGRLVRAVMVIRLMTGLLLVYQALIVSLFNRSELDCLELVALAPDQLVVRGREGVALSLPSFILPVIRTQACPAFVVPGLMMVVIVPKVTIIVLPALFLPVSDHV